MKKVLSTIIASVIAIATCCSLTGCSDKNKGEKGEINLFIWTEYVPDSVISKFEDETGIKVNVSTYSSNEDLYAKMKSESDDAYDIVQPSDYMVEKLAAQGMLQEIDGKSFENISNIADQYLNPEFDSDNKYSVPYLGGVAAIAVNTSKIKDGEIKSYNDLFDSKYKSSEVVLDDSRAIIGITASSLGYSMSTTDETELSKIKEKLMTIKPNIKLYDSDSPKSALISGDCSIGMCWSAEVALAMEENPDIKVVFPEEKAYLFLDNWCVPKGSKKVDLCKEFINYMLKPEVMQEVLKEFPYMCPNKEAVKLMGEEYEKNTAKNIPEDVIENGEYIKMLDTDTQAKYEAMWTELKN